MSRRRLDLELVRRGLAPTRARAQEAIEAGLVLVGGAPASKSARLVQPGEALRLLEPPSRFVGRGGEKLNAALTRFAVDVAGRRCTDAGASTGGFTDCLLQRGARQVVAVDVGYGQLHERLRDDARVVNLERRNIRHVMAEDLGGPAEVVVADLSFISLRTVAGDLVALADAAADIVVLVKPQFEAGRVEVARGRGVVRDPAIWLGALEGVRDAFGQAGASMVDAMTSPLTGAEGNVEFLAHLRPSCRGAVAVDLGAVVDDARRRHGGT